MKNVVPLRFDAPASFVTPNPVLQEVVVDNKIPLFPAFPAFISVCRAAAPKILIYFGERICNIV